MAMDNPPWMRSIYIIYEHIFVCLRFLLEKRGPFRGYFGDLEKVTSVTNSIIMIRDFNTNEKIRTSPDPRVGYASSLESNHPNCFIKLCFHQPQLPHRRLANPFFCLPHFYDDQVTTCGPIEKVHVAGKTHTQTSWWFQPIWTICSSNWIILAGIGVKITNLWVATT